MLTKLKEMGREKCHQYWPDARSVRYQYYVVDPVAEYNMPQYKLREFKVSTGGMGQKFFIGFLETGGMGQKFFIEFSETGEMGQKIFIEFSETGEMGQKILH